MASSKESPGYDPLKLQGLDFFWLATKAQIHNRHEVALALTHWILVSNGFRCIGRDSELPTSSETNRVGTELLPDRWNERTDGFYSLLYISASNTPSGKKKMFLVKLIPVSNADDEIITGNLLIVDGSPDVIPFEIDSNRFIPENWQTFDSPRSFPQFGAFVQRIENDIVAKVSPASAAEKRKEASSEESSSQSSSSRFQPEPSRPYVPQPLQPPPLREFIPGSSRVDPYGLGSRDLDPFGGMGGNVLGPQHFRPGGGIPGFGGGGLMGMPYRYDPPGPPELNPRGPPGLSSPFAPSGVGIGQVRPRLPRAPLQPGEPDPDHFLPPRGPGDDPDNMFM